MLIDARTIISSDSSLNFKFTDIPEAIVDFISPETHIRQVVTEVVARHVIGRIYVTLDIRCEYDSVCARCMENLTRQVETHSDLCYIPEGNEADAEDVDFTTYTGHFIDLSEAIIDGIYSAMPVRDLCVEDCKGICPKCGINLNLESCNCSHKEIDPRLAGLAKLLE